jgi:hypothetical protein
VPSVCREEIRIYKITAKDQENIQMSKELGMRPAVLLSTVRSFCF